MSHLPRRPSREVPRNRIGHVRRSRPDWHPAAGKRNLSGFPQPVTRFPIQSHCSQSMNDWMNDALSPLRLRTVCYRQTGLPSIHGHAVRKLDARCAAALPARWRQVLGHQVQRHVPPLRVHQQNFLQEGLLRQELHPALPATSQIPLKTFPQSFPCLVDSIENDGLDDSRDTFTWCTTGRSITTSKAIRVSSDTSWTRRGRRWSIFRMPPFPTTFICTHRCRCRSPSCPSVKSIPVSIASLVVPIVVVTAAAVAVCLKWMWYDVTLTSIIWIVSELLGLCRRRDGPVGDLRNCAQQQHGRGQAQFLFPGNRVRLEHITEQSASRWDVYRLRSALRRRQRLGTQHQNQVPTLKSPFQLNNIIGCGKLRHNSITARRWMNQGLLWTCTKTNCSTWSCRSRIRSGGRPVWATTRAPR